MLCQYISYRYTYVLFQISFPFRSPQNTEFPVLYSWLLVTSFPRWLSGKESICNAGDLGLIPELGRSPEGGNTGTPWTDETRELYTVHGWSCKVLDTTKRLTHTYIVVYICQSLPPNSSHPTPLFPLCKHKFSTSVSLFLLLQISSSV